MVFGKVSSKVLKSQTNIKVLKAQSKIKILWARYQTKKFKKFQAEKALISLSDQTQNLSYLTLNLTFRIQNWLQNQWLGIDHFSECKREKVKKKTIWKNTRLIKVVKKIIKESLLSVIKGRIPIKFLSRLTQKAFIKNADKIWRDR